VAEAKRCGFQGVVCGHINRAEMREIDGLLYCNDGDWVESLTALVETHEGQLKIIEWRTRVESPLNLGPVHQEELFTEGIVS
jgi:UDP-2,3-diacylglucosamine pyrophosphatase LpxH